MEEYTTEVEADLAIEEGREFIHVEQRFIQTEHSLYDALGGWHNIIIHLQTELHQKHHMYELTEQLQDKVFHLTKYVREEMFTDVKLVAEEEHLLKKLKEHIKHREWKAEKHCVGLWKKLKVHAKRREWKEIKHWIVLLKKNQLKVLKLEEHEIEKIRSAFKDIMQLMEKSHVIKALDKDLVVNKEKKHYEIVAEYYFIQIYKLARAYERIFKQLWLKERLLERELQKEINKNK